MKHTRIHFIGIGGVSMSRLAREAAQKGASVTGSDAVSSEITDALSAMGIPVFIGHDAKHVAGADIVVRTSAAGDDNPEVAAARAAGIPIKERADCLSEYASGFPAVIAVAGSHGKTTACGMAGYILSKAGLKPALHIGGELRPEDGADAGSGEGAGGGTVLVCEACEYRRNFLKLRPFMPVVLNIAEDHLDYYRDLNDIKDAFREFLSLRPDGGVAVVNGDDPNVLDVIGGRRGAAVPLPPEKAAALAPGIAAADGRTLVTFGLSRGNYYRARRLTERGGKYSFNLHEGGKLLCRVDLNLPGRHNVYNALAAAAVARIFGAAPEIISAALWSFKGMKRRFEYMGKYNGAAVVHDYAHHPEEIVAVIRAARLGKPARLICVLQPHTYTRTRLLMDGFAASLAAADIPVVARIYPAREPPLPGVTAEALAAAVRRRNPAAACPGSDSETAEFLKRTAKEGDLILILGAGDIDILARELVK